MKKLLWIGDAACTSGFARATHEILDRVRYEYDVSVLGINYHGDPAREGDDYSRFYVDGRWPYLIYPAMWEFEPFGLRKLHQVCAIVEPDVIVIQQDGWNIPDYIRVLRAKKPNGEYYALQHASIPVVAAVPVDGKNFRGPWLDGVALTIFWTQFALDEARDGGYVGPAHVIPLGVDLDTFHPVDRNEALGRLGIGVLGDKFIVGNVNRNQPRKRWDLTIKYFAEWVKAYKVTDAKLFLHAAPTGDSLVDVEQLMRYYGIIEMLALREPAPYQGASESVMRDTYNCFDVDITTTQGEGFGLTTLEAMACGVPPIVPGWAALGEWAKRGAWVVPCTSTVINPIATTNVIGGVPDEKSFILALNRLYMDKDARKRNAQAALECAQQACYRWQNIGDAWVKAIDSVMNPIHVEVDTRAVTKAVVEQMPALLKRGGV